jgi:two-component system, OmpR family, sensor histidine kinase KdpD
MALDRLLGQSVLRAILLYTRQSFFGFYSYVDYSMLINGYPMMTHQPIARRYGLALLMLAAITVLIFFVAPPLETTTIILSYLLGVLLVATTSGLGSGILASLGSFLAFNFFFLSPRYTFHVADTQDILHLVSFLSIAIIASSLSARAQRAAERENGRAAELAALYELSQTISAQVDLTSILPIIAEKTCRLLHSPTCSILLYNDAGRLIEHARFDQAVPGLKRINVPIRDGATVLGILRVVEPHYGKRLSQENQQLLITLAAQVRLAIDRARLVAQTAHSHALLEADQLKSALLASVSHDLRTPIAIMKGATSTLLADDIAWDALTRHTLTQSIDSELDHLNRIVGNLLDMSRVEGNALSAQRDWQNLTEVLGVVLQRMQPMLEGRALTVEVDPDLPLVASNAMLIDQVLTNLLENAIKYTPSGTPITILVSHDSTSHGVPTVTTVVRDHGPGIPAHDLKRIFHKFYRLGDSATRTSGAGLGLAICKGIIEAHGGRIWAENSCDGGAAFMFTLPLGAATTQDYLGTFPEERYASRDKVMDCGIQSQQNESVI